MKKEKIIIRASILSERKNEYDKTLLLKKKFGKENNPQITEKNQKNIFVLEKKFKIIKNENDIKNNIFDLKQNNKKILEVLGVSKSISKKPILKNISLKLEPGQIVGLLGPNGSGKTTLFNLIIGKIFPDMGKITFNNEVINDMPIHLRSLKGISLLEQHKGLFGNMTAEENLYAILELHIKKKDKIKERIDNLLAYFDLDYLKNIKANFLSGGEYKKVSILQRICNPNISTLLLDEPCAALDPLSINSLKNFILELKKMGLSILVTDHNYWAIESILDKAYLIKDGQILVEGSTEKISNDQNAIKYYLGANFKF